MVTTKETGSLESKMKNIFNIELFYRALSVLIFVPMMLLPIVYSNYSLVIVYLIFNSIILYELFSMKSAQRNLVIVNISIAISTITFFIFILLNVTESLTYIVIIEIIITIWLFDTFSFLGGKIFGGKKLMPTISSGKTISGLLIGITFTLCSSQLYQIFSKVISFESTLFTTIIILFAFIGDLAASYLKRSVSIKDSGSIMPGHGGLLDRLDSFIGVFFVFGIVSLIK